MGLISKVLNKFRFYKLDDMLKVAKQVATENKSANEAKVELLESENEKYQYLEPSNSITYATMYKYYKEDEWIRACVDTISKVASKAKIIVKVKDDIKETDEHKKQIEEVKALLDNPNQRSETLTTIRKKLIKDLMIYDAAALELVYDTNGKVVELYDLPGPYVRLNVDKHGYFKDTTKAYKLLTEEMWRQEKQPVAFDYKEVIYFALNVEAGHIYGLSPIETLVRSVSADINASEYNSSFFDNNALLPGILTIPGLDDTAIKLFKQRWFRNTKGAKNAHKLVITNQEGIDFKRMSENPKDMEFMNYQKWILQKIMSIYNTNPFVLGVVDVNTGKLNSKEQWNTFIEKAIEPILNLESNLYTSKLINLGFGYNDIEIKFSDLTIEDTSQIAEEAEKVTKSDIMTLNEVRKKYYGLPEVPWGEVPYDVLKAGLTPTKSTNPTNKSLSLETEDEKELLPELEEKESLSLRAKILNMIDESIKEE